MSESDVVPSSMGLRRVPAGQVALQLEHVSGCLCARRPLHGEDVKVIDARCIAAYLVPRG